MNMINKEPERHELETLLPWHAAGTLNRRDADRVEQALACDRELAQRYHLVREELAETIHLNETLGAPSARAMEKLFAAIDAEEARLPRRKRAFDLGGRISEFLSGFAPRTLAWSATAAAAAILLQAAVITTVMFRDHGAAGHHRPRQCFGRRLVRGRALCSASDRDRNHQLSRRAQGHAGRRSVEVGRQSLSPASRRQQAGSQRGQQDHPADAGRVEGRRISSPWRIRGHGRGCGTRAGAHRLP